MIGISKIFLIHTPPRKPILPPCGKHHSAKNAGQMCFSCVPLISYSTVGGQISPLRVILSSVGSLRKCLDLLGGKVELLKMSLCWQKRRHFISPLARLLGSRLQGVQMLWKGERWPQVMGRS